MSRRSRRAAGHAESLTDAGENDRVLFYVDDKRKKTAKGTINRKLRLKYNILREDTGKIETNIPFENIVKVLKEVSSDEEDSDSPVKGRRSKKRSAKASKPKISTKDKDVSTKPNAVLTPKRKTGPKSLKQRVPEESESEATGDDVDNYEEDEDDTFRTPSKKSQEDDEPRIAVPEPAATPAIKTKAKRKAVASLAKGDGSSKKRKNAQDDAEAVLTEPEDEDLQDYDFTDDQIQKVVQACSPYHNKNAKNKGDSKDKEPPTKGTTNEVPIPFYEVELKCRPILSGYEEKDLLKLWKAILKDEKYKAIVESIGTKFREEKDLEKSMHRRKESKKTRERFSTMEVTAIMEGYQRWTTEFSKKQEEKRKELEAKGETEEEEKTDENEKESGKKKRRNLEKGKWTSIKKSYPDILHKRSCVDIKDKYRNFVKKDIAEEILQKIRNGESFEALLSNPPKTPETVEKNKKSRRDRLSAGVYEKHYRVGTKKKRKIWTPAEVKALIDGMAEVKGSKWTQIKELDKFKEILADRTSLDLKDKWRVMQRQEARKKKAADEPAASEPPAKKAATSEPVPPDVPPPAVVEV